MLAENLLPADGGKADLGSGSTGAGGGTGVLAGAHGLGGLGGLAARRRSLPVLVSGEGSSGEIARL